jgi:hypothetical protein
VKTALRDYRHGFRRPIWDEAALVSTAAFKRRACNVPSSDSVGRSPGFGTVTTVCIDAGGWRFPVRSMLVTCSATDRLPDPANVTRVNV